ncbi:MULTISPECIES: hypothetical protein [Agrobacterium]|uniref:hypothetical protein n=1 Tax=Agrobacterium TaxID=357 RepID=UPI000E0F9607|nr:hypothetical protein [Agrobacterium sp. SORGH_AS_0745]MDP9759361.1 hypothetical protein [Agrobacterium tumefaciens]MDQ1223788.1 hypothetical protein [Agrobacterium sp. SORGH_AS_0745]
MLRFINRFRGRFSIGGKRTKYSFVSFWKWSYYNVDTPLLRGVLIEYLVISILLENAARVVFKRVRDLTHDTITQKAIRKSLSPFYSYQPHGDVFDLQLHWGITIEIKSTENLETGRLHKTHWWGPINQRDNGSKLFPAQYYILAELVAPEGSETEHHRKRKHELPEIRCYVCRGRDLEDASAENESISYSRWAEIAGKSCSFFELPDVLGVLCDEDTDALTNDKVTLGWKIPRPSSNQTPLPRGTDRVYAPIAREEGTEIKLAWWDITETPQELNAIPTPWRDGVKPDLRDWEAAGFKYERAPKLDESGNRISNRKKTKDSSATSETSKD